MILAGDIGGTNTRLALFDGDLREPVALPPMASGGVYLGRFAPLPESIPVRVILDDKAALLGAARHAANGGLQ